MELYLLHILHCIYCTVLIVLYLFYCTYYSVLSVITVLYCTCFHSVYDSTVNVALYIIFVFPKVKQSAKNAYFEPNFERP
jgi:hypothetical protein